MSYPPGCLIDSFKFLVRFRFAGQNLGYYGNSHYYRPTGAFIRGIMRAFYREYQDANMTYIRQYQDHDKLVRLFKIIHFTFYDAFLRFPEAN
jgi:hypothetical protein